jgi:hypothetical protein
VSFRPGSVVLLSIIQSFVFVGKGKNSTVSTSGIELLSASSTFWNANKRNTPRPRPFFFDDGRDNDIILKWNASLCCMNNRRL